MSKLIAPSSSRMITAGGAGLGASVSSINRTGKGISGSQESLVSEKSSVYSTASVAMHKHLTTAQTKTAKLTPKSSVNLMILLNNWLKKVQKKRNKILEDW